MFWTTWSKWCWKNLSH
uniref:Uncharacterized protein n=1 Tax=Arundo donax TaxID=35708 RepID=A0A0A9BVN7_ARUDO